MADSIKVAVRVRSFNQREIDLGCSLTISMSSMTTTLLPRSEGEEPSTFTFDFNWWSFDPSSPVHASQETIMKDVGEDMLNNATAGFNGCIFAYGQTGSGKTYSVIGYKDAPGIIPRLVGQLFATKSDLEADPKQELRIWASYIEIYNEEVHDLLAQQEDHELRLMDHPHLGIIVRDLHEVPCQTEEELTSLMDMGIRKRAVGSTRMNAASSRSHTVFTLKLQRLQGERPRAGTKDQRVALKAKMNFVDLAGSERLSKTFATGIRRREAANINQSLSALARIIKDLGTAMTKAESHGKGPPSGKELAHLGWRSSKLTFLLRDSLAGNSKTCMIAAISPANDNYEETLSTLEFASSVKKVKTKASKNEHAEEDMIEKMKQELQELRQHVIGSEADHLHKIQEEERLIEQMKHDYESQLLKTQEILDSRSKATKDMTLSLDELNETLGLEPSTPYLVNMSDDPALAGCLFYCLPANGVIVAGSDASCAIRVPGPAIPKQLCEIKSEKGTEKVNVRRLAQGRVQVNGRALQGDDSQELSNGCRLALGRSVVVKLVMPSGTKMQDGDQLVFQNLEKEWASIEDSPSWGKLQVSLDDLMKDMSLNEAKNITTMAEEVVRMCEEANEITMECRACEGLLFEAHLVVTPPASVGIRVLRKFVDAGDSHNTTKDFATICFYFWTIEKMHERLESMRAYYLILSRSGRPPVDAHSLNDPWFEPTMVDFAMLSAELEEANQEKMMLRMANAKAEIVAQTLRSELQLSSETPNHSNVSDAEATNLRDLLTKSESEKGSLQKDLEEKQKHLDEATQALRELEDNAAKMKHAMDQLSEDVCLYKNDNDHLNKVVIPDVQAKLHASDVEATNLRDLLATSESEKGSLRKDLEEKQKHLDEATQALRELEDNAAKMKHAMDQLSEDVCLYKNDNDHLNKVVIPDVQAKLHASDAEATNLRDLLATSESEKGTLQKDLEEKQKHLDEATQALRELEDNAAKMKHAMDQLSEDVRFYKSDNQHVNKVVIPDVHAKLNAAKARLIAAEADCCKELSLAKDSRHTRDDEIESLRKELEEASGATCQANEEVRRLRASVFLSSFQAPATLLHREDQSRSSSNSRDFWDSQDDGLFMSQHT